MKQLTSRLGTFPQSQQGKCLRKQHASPELLRAVARTDECIQWQQEYLAQ